MKPVLFVLAALLVVSASWAQPQYQKQTPPQQTPPAASQGAQPGSKQQPNSQPGAAQGQQGAQPGAAADQAAPAGKHPPQAKSQEEFKAFNDANALTDPAAIEKAADDFATKFPSSELRILLYRKAMIEYQNANNADKMVDMGHKVLGIDPDDPQALVSVAEVLSERTRPTDLDANEKYAEATKLAKHALETIDTDLTFSAQVPPDKVKQAKDWLRSTSYSVLGNLEMAKNDYAAAEKDLRQAIDLNAAQPDPVNYLRLAVALDKQNKYADALTAANKAAELAPENTQVGTLARREQDRLKQLTGGSTGASNAAPGAKPQTSQPRTTPPQQQQ